MKHADCPIAEVEVHVDAPPERLWPLITDIDVPARFSSEFCGGQWLEGSSGPVAGARFRGRNTHPARGEWETTSTVVACEEPRLFAWAVGDFEGKVTNPGASWRFELIPEAGGTRLRQWAQLGPGPSGLTQAIAAMPDKEERIIERRLEDLRRNMQATVEGIKALAEHGDAGDVHRS